MDRVFKGHLHGVRREGNEGHSPYFKMNERSARLLLGSAKSLCAFDTCQVDDYAKVVIESFDPLHKAKQRAEALPQDCQRAFEMGRRLAGAETVAA